MIDRIEWARRYLQRNWRKQDKIYTERNEKRREWEEKADKKMTDKCRRKAVKAKK